MPQLDYPPNNSYHQVYEIDIRHKGQNNSNANITVATKKDLTITKNVHIPTL